MPRSISLFATLLAAPLAFAQELMSDQDARDQMKYDIQYLASDRLEGREAGTPGEKMAADYIVQKFNSIGLMPYGDSATYLQKFTFAAEPVLGSANRLQIGRRQLKIGEEWYPLAYASPTQVRGKLLKCGYGIQAPELYREDFKDLDLKDRVVAFSISSPDGVHPHSKFIGYDLRKRVDMAVERGASAVILFNDDETAEPPSEGLSAKVQACGVPVVFLKGKLYDELVLDANPVAMAVDIQRPQLVAENVVGLIDNGQSNVVVIGAHFDHLGRGIEGSLWRGEPAIHNGADDNASGVAAMLQLARDLKEMPEAHSNDYLFIAFSGEEEGLYGSNYWTKHPTMPLAELNYMINMDMVGRLDTSNAIAINGVGTSPAWQEVSHVLVGDLKVKTGESGVGPSDHTSFYLQNIPAIHFFTGSHEDYHKPSDDEEKINYDGMLRVVRFIEALVTTLNDDGKLAFTKTKDDENEEVPHFTVTLGVVPDYLYSGSGMRIDGITEGKPAANAGLKVGDVVMDLGGNKVTDMMSYMKALGMFKKGDTTKVTVLREGKEVTTDIQF